MGEPAAPTRCPLVPLREAGEVQPLAGGHSPAAPPPRVPGHLPGAVLTGAQALSWYVLHYLLPLPQAPGACWSLSGLALPSWPWAAPRC